MGDKSLRFSIGLSVGDGTSVENERVQEALERPAFKQRLAGEGADVRVAGVEDSGEKHFIRAERRGL